MKIGTIGILLAVAWSEALPSDLEWRPFVVGGGAARGEPIALASGDLDGDGVPDLVCGFAGPDGPFLMLVRGNVDAIYPHTSAARQRRGEGTFTDAPFVGPGRVIERSASTLPEPTSLIVLDDTTVALPMRLNADALPDYVVLRKGKSISLALSTTQATITVTSAADNVTAGDGACTLREAILNSNANADSTAGDCVAGAGTDAIGFHIGGGGSPVTIPIASALPPLSDPVTINGNTQGCPAPPCIDLNGIPSLFAHGLELAGGNNTVRGLVIRGFDEQGILVSSAGNFIEGNYIGTDASGTIPFPNSMAGVFLSSSDNTVGGTTVAARNLLSGNTDGVNMNQAASANTVIGNYIGTNAAGTGSLPNAVWGIFVGGSGNVIGGTVPGARNVVSGNALGGVGVNGSSAFGNQLSGNWVGIDATGTAAMPNQSGGIIFSNGAFGNTVGGSTADSRNVVSGNADFGIVFGTGATGNVVQGNYVGTDPTGTVDLGNGLSGILLQDAPGNTIGGASDGARNLISGNDQHGVFVFEANGPSGDNEVLGNRIGTDAGGTVALPNTLDGVRIVASPNNTIGGNQISGNGSNGVRIDSGAVGVRVLGNLIGTDANGAATLGNNRIGVLVQNASGNSIGGTLPGDGNVIAGSATQGVSIVGSSVSNGVLGNSILGSGALGIDLNAPDGVTPNDAGDADTGPNDRQNYPDLTSAAGTVSTVTIDGTLSSVATTTYGVEFFAGEVCDATGHGEGERVLGFANVSTDGTGSMSFSEILTATVEDGDAITATATDPLDNTSEFSACVFASCREIVTFSQTVLAQNRDSLVWAAPADVHFVKGDLAGVATYQTTAEGSLVAATMLDISLDDPAPGTGLYFVLKPSGCGSWQTEPGAEPDRDASLP